jgi:signal transduction histidine kinase
MFSEVGKTFAFLIHDIKGMYSSKMVYVDLIREWLKTDLVAKKEKEILTYLIEDIQSAKELVLDVNSLINSEFSTKITTIRLSGALVSAKILLKSKLRNIEVILEGDLELEAKSYLLTRALLNLLSNCVDEIKRKNIDPGKIHVACNSTGFEVRDNSGSVLDKNILKALNGHFLSKTTKKQGSGLGSYIVKDYISLMGGKIRFYNEVDGLVAKIEFSRKAISAQKKNHSKLEAIL